MLSHFSILRIGIVLILLISTSQAQVRFQKTYSYWESNATRLMQTDDGGYLLSGSMFGTIMLVKTDSLGVQQWVKKYPGLPQGATNEAFERCPDGGYLIAGMVYPGYYFLKLDSLFDVSWCKQYDVSPLILYSIEYNGYYAGEFSVRAHAFSDGTFALAGKLEEPLSSFFHFEHVMHLDNTGSVIWSNAYNQDGKDGIHDMKIVTMPGDTFQSILTCAGILDTLPPYALAGHLTLIDPSGNIVWSRHCDNSILSKAYNVCQAHDGGFIFTGIGSTATYSGITCVRTNYLGNVLWAKTYNFNLLGWGNSVKETSDHGFIIAGIYVDSINHWNHATLIRIDSTGQLLWCKRYDGATSNYVMEVIQTSDGGFAFCGSTLLDTFNIPMTMYLVKTDENGNSGCLEESIETAIENNTPNFYSFGDQAVYPVVESTASATGQVAVINETVLCLDNPVTEIPGYANFEIVPNPSGGLITLKFLSVSDFSGLRIELFDASGRQISAVPKFKLNPGESVSLDIRDLPAGLYFIKAGMRDASLAGRFIKE